MKRRRRKKLVIPEAMACPECIRESLDIVALIATLSEHEQALSRFSVAVRAGRARQSDLDELLFSWGVISEVVHIACEAASGFCENTAVTGTVN